jgi:hypothetical protein
MAGKAQYLITDEHRTHWLVCKGDPAYTYVTVLSQTFPIISLPRYILMGIAGNAPNCLVSAQLKLDLIGKLAALDDSPDVLESYKFQSNYVSCLQWVLEHVF